MMRNTRYLKTYSELSSNREMLERAYYYYFGQADMFHYQKVIKRDLRNEGKGTGTKKKGNFGMYEAVPIGRSRKGVPL